MTGWFFFETDLPTLTAEINAYKRVAGVAIFEIGRRLKSVRDAKSDSTDPNTRRLARQREEAGGWIRWLEEHVDFTRQHAHRFITIYEEIGGPDVTRVLHERSLRFLYEIATLPPEERTREHTLKSGVTKTVDEMTEMPDASNAHIRRTINFVIKRKNGAQAKRIILRRLAPLTVISVSVAFRQHIRHARASRRNYSGNLQRGVFVRADNRQYRRSKRGLKIPARSPMGINKPIKCNFVHERVAGCEDEKPTCQLNRVAFETENFVARSTIWKNDDVVAFVRIESSRRREVCT